MAAQGALMKRVTEKKQKRKCSERIPVSHRKQANSHCCLGMALLCLYLCVYLLTSFVNNRDTKLTMAAPWGFSQFWMGFGTQVTPTHFHMQRKVVSFVWAKETSAGWSQKNYFLVLHLAKTFGPSFNRLFPKMEYMYLKGTRSYAWVMESIFLIYLDVPE